MMTLVIGPPQSGKSERAEQLVLARTTPEDRVYLATMLIEDEAGEQRVRRHQQRREGKQFQTLEIPWDIDRVLTELDRPETKTILLECLTNLVANAYFLRKEKDVPKKICAEIENVQKGVKDLIVVTTQYEQAYYTDRETKHYLSLLQETNERIRQRADAVVEVGL